jgi:hypothetical protein
VLLLGLCADHDHRNAAEGVLLAQRAADFVPRGARERLCLDVNRMHMYLSIIICTLRMTESLTPGHGNAAEGVRLAQRAADLVPVYCFPGFYSKLRKGENI